jgi:hypothetical protein
VGVNVLFPCQCQCHTHAFRQVWEKLQINLPEVEKLSDFCVMLVSVKEIRLKPNRVKGGDAYAR